MSNIFGNTGASNTSGSAGGGLFGSGSTGSTTGATGGLFGAKPAQGGSLFGATNTGGSLFGGSSTTTPAAGTGLFGGSATTPSQPGTGGTFAPAQPSTNPLFGGGGAFSLPKPDQGSNNAPKPATSLFGQPNAATPTSSASPAPTFCSGLFGAKPAESSTTANPASGSGTTPTSTTATNPTAPNPFSGGLFGKPPAPATSTTTPAAGAATTSATSAPSTTGGLNFSLGGSTSTTAPAGGGLFGAPKPAEKKDEKPPAAPAPAGGLFGAPKPEEKKDATTGLSGGVSLGKPEGEKTTSTTAPSSAPVVAVPPPSMLRGKTIEEIVNKWSTELETHVKEFNKFAAEVSMWDRALIENGNNLATLYSHVLAAEREQNEVDQSLDHIEQQQKDLAATLDSYEKVTEEIFGGGGGSLRALDTGPADTERDKNYMLATDLHTHLDDLSNSLTQMIDSVNSLSIPAGSDTPSEDPMTQISQILSTHLESLQWIDGAVREIEGKVTEVEKRVKDSGHAVNLNGTNAKPRGFGVR
ncbi:FG-nucleoporin nsp1 [Marasmius tenuissimus]|nr:FG-nucleoporin nsp1 [Marasmius tenuissimus]